MKITETALRFRTTVYVLILFIVIAGSVAYVSLPLEANPEVEIPFLLVSTVYPGVSPEDMERLVTNVLERELKYKIFASIKDALVVFHLIRFVDHIGSIADHAQNASDRMRTMIAR